MILREELKLIFRQANCCNPEGLTDEIIKRIVKVLRDELDNTNFISPLNMNFGKSEISRLNGCTYDGIKKAITVVQKKKRYVK